MGPVIVRDLAASDGVERVTVADVDAERAARVAAETPGSAEVVGIGADVTSPEFADLLRGHDVCVASVAYRLNPLITAACLEARCGYVDLGGLFHVARKTLDLHHAFRDAGITGVTCTGGAPGITNMLAVVGARELDEVHAVHVRLGAVDPSIEGVPLPIPYSIETLLDEFSIPAMAYRDGDWHEVEPLGEPEEVDFGGVVGRRTAVTTLHSEVATLPRAFPSVREVTFKIAFEPGFAERFRLLAAIGLASTEPVSVRGAEVRPRDVLVELARRLPQAEGVEDTECLRVVLEGTREGERRTVVAECEVGPDREAGLGGGARNTGIPPSIVAQMIGNGEIAKGPGMFAPEESVDADLFFARLADRGISYAVRRE